ncbi:hypothetical protein I2W78_00225 [Streptomyces spinoverrucosus]|uniref:hypothetical protein n=1 Tax=Streptomyces spinoverrucosus TaxID=284043 RepID=UPI0018C3642B|nr:hypothetical protein [Streptomyces spinoverrucosus]MBG0850343.1 hypothetical protein [Streptomyces spinoverrucosus]
MSGQQLGVGEGTGGKHRAAGLTELLARELRHCGRQVGIEHLHIHRPRVLTAADRTHTAATERETPR